MEGIDRRGSFYAIPNSYFLKLTLTKEIKLKSNRTAAPKLSFVLNPDDVDLSWMEIFKKYHEELYEAVVESPVFPELRIADFRTRIRNRKNWSLDDDVRQFMEVFPPDKAVYYAKFRIGDGSWPWESSCAVPLVPLPTLQPSPTPPPTFHPPISPSAPPPPTFVPSTSHPPNSPPPPPTPPQPAPPRKKISLASVQFILEEDHESDDSSDGGTVIINRSTDQPRNQNQSNEDIKVSPNSQNPLGCSSGGRVEASSPSQPSVINRPRLPTRYPNVTRPNPIIHAKLCQQQSRVCAIAPHSSSQATFGVENSSQITKEINQLIRNSSQANKETPIPVTTSTPIGKVKEDEVAHNLSSSRQAEGNRQSVSSSGLVIVSVSSVDAAEHQSKMMPPPPPPPLVTPSLARSSQSQNKRKYVPHISPDPFAPSANKARRNSREDLHNDDDHYFPGPQDTPTGNFDETASIASSGWSLEDSKSDIYRAGVNPNTHIKNQVMDRFLKRVDNTTMLRVRMELQRMYQGGDKWMRLASRIPLATNVLQRVFLGDGDEVPMT